jgi:hypothetical protein
MNQQSVSRAVRRAGSQAVVRSRPRLEHRTCPSHNSIRLT